MHCPGQVDHRRLHWWERARFHAGSPCHGAVCLAIATTLASAQSPPQDSPRIELTATTTTATSVRLGVDEHTAQLVRMSPAWRVEATDEAHGARFVQGDSQDGKHHALLSGKGLVGDARVALEQRIVPPLNPGEAYSVSAYCRGSIGNVGSGLLRVQRRATGEAGWSDALSLSLSPGRSWRRENGEFLAARADEWRVRIELKGEGTLRVDSASLAESDRLDLNRLNDPSFEGSYYWRVQMRAEGGAEWVPLPPVIRERQHNVIGLRPETVYEFRAELVSPAGRVEAATPPISAQTQRLAPREWEGMTLREPIRLAIEDAAFPCIEAFGDKLLLAYSSHGAIILAELSPRLEVLSTREVVPAYPSQNGLAVQSELQTCLLGDRLYISFKRDHEPFITSARQCIVEVNLTSQEVRGPAVIESTRLGGASWNGGIAAADGQLWVGYTDTKVADDVPGSEIVLRRFDPRTMAAEPSEYVLTDAPSRQPYAPFLASWRGSIVVLFSDMAQAYRSATAGAEIDEPLYVCLFDGRRFATPCTISATGRNRYAKAVDLYGRLLVAWKCGSSYPASEWGEYMFHDIELALVDPLSGPEASTAYVGDAKYNSSPAMARMGDRVILVSTKHEHLYGLADDPAESLGVYAGRIDLGRR